MEKLVENLSVHDYDEVEDMIGELLSGHFGIQAYSFDYLEKGVEYVVGTINIVKLGETPSSLSHSHRQKDGTRAWTDDIKVTESYEYATYYRLDKFNELCKNTLSGSWSETYNFNKLLSEQ